MAAFVEGAKQIVICMVLTTLVENLLKESEYRRYVRLFMGFLMILLVMKPVAALFSKDLDGQMDWNRTLISMEDDTELLLSTDEKRREMLEEEYEKVFRKRVESILRGYGYELSHLTVRWTKEKSMEVEEMEVVVADESLPADEGAEEEENRTVGSGGEEVDSGKENKESVQKVEKVKKRKKVQSKLPEEKKQEGDKKAGEIGEEKEIREQICRDMGLLEGQVKLYVE